MKETLMVGLVATALVLVAPPARAQDKIPVNDKIELAKVDLAEGAPAELKPEFDEFFRALGQELKTQAGSFGAECNWRIFVKLVIKPKSKVVEITLDPGRSAAPRIMTTGFARKADLGEDGFKEAIKNSVKLILTRAANC